jgi:hypothetical protein
MIRPVGVRPRPGWDRGPAASAVDTLMGRRRWRILQTALPDIVPSEPVPLWIRTPEQFVDWLSVRVRPNDLRGYFLTLEDIARRSCDLELLRFVGTYLGRPSKVRRG